MIFTDVSIIVKNGISKQDKSIFVYRGDRNIEVRFTIESPFRYTDTENLITDVNAYYSRLVIKKPGKEDDNIFSPIVPTDYGVARFLITSEMINEVIENGSYDYQIILYDENLNSRVTIPPVVGGLIVLEPIDLEDESISGDTNVGTGSPPQVEDDNLETFNEKGEYNKTDWENGGLITSSKLNKIEDALYDINEKANEVTKEIEEVTLKTNESTEKYNELIEKYNILIEKHNTLVEGYEELTKKYEELAERVSKCTCNDTDIEVYDYFQDIDGNYLQDIDGNYLI